MAHRSALRQNLVLVFCLGLLAYFAFHAFEGRHGLDARGDLHSRASALESRLAAHEIERLRLRRNVALLRDDQIDPDMLAEQARRLLVMTHPDDVVLIPARRSAAKAPSNARVAPIGDARQRLRSTGASR